VAGHHRSQRSHSSLLKHHIPTPREISYRPEIDGLRAVAVVAVVLFHAGIPGFGGGFVGVDIFFVISGYLIASILLSRIEKGNLSLVEFYEKRARRLLPALYAMMLISIPMAWAYMLPDPLENFGQSVVATVLFGNNVLLYLTSGYWDVATEFKPLMHTWSLGVEEQFYLVFPILIILLWKLGRNFLFIVILITAFASLVVSTVLLGVDPEANFYLLTSRVWELLAGALG
jgi:peptidoglycan/LPS O-acetylase OafA/YrhL